MSKSLKVHNTGSLAVLLIQRPAGQHNRARVKPLHHFPAPFFPLLPQVSSSLKSSFLPSLCLLLLCCSPRNGMKKHKKAAAAALRNRLDEKEKLTARQRFSLLRSCLARGRTCQDVHKTQLCLTAPAGTQRVKAI